MSNFKRINEAIQYGITDNCIHFHISLEDISSIAKQIMNENDFVNASNPEKFLASFEEIEKLFIQALNFAESNDFQQEYPNVTKIYMISPLVSKHKVQHLLEKYNFEIRDFSQMGEEEKILAYKIFKNNAEEVSVAEKLLYNKKKSYL